uniref:Uncharacterized protein n=1 Tax=Quercus lobata TaxID=97700 RepID=A0A7N2KQX2_QUELO
MASTLLGPNSTSSTSAARNRLHHMVDFFKPLVTAPLLSKTLEEGSSMLERPCTLRIGSMRSLHLSAPLAFTNTGKDHSFSAVVKFWNALFFTGGLDLLLWRWVCMTSYPSCEHPSNRLSWLHDYPLGHRVSFLADLGGLYCISIGIFFYLLVQFEYRIKKLRNEDSVLRKIRNRRKAQDHWDKLRKYVKYTWGCNTLDDDYKKPQNKSSCSSFMVQSVHRNGSSHKRSQQNKMDFNKKLSLPNEKTAISESSCTTGVKSCVAGTAPISQGWISDSSDAPSISEYSLPNFLPVFTYDCCLLDLVRSYAWLMEDHGSNHSRHIKGVL